MQILNSILHGILKEKQTTGAKATAIKLRKNLLPINKRIENLGDEILKLYSKLSNGYGILASADEINRFPSFLEEFEKSQISFIEFSNKTVSVISESMSNQALSTTSYPVFIEYENQNRKWLLIAVLKLKEGVGLNEETLDLNESLIFDISNLREAARIDIEKWKNNTQPYLSFIKKGGSADTESSKYFRAALSCLDYTDAKHNTEEVIRALKDYCNTKDMSQEDRQKAKSVMLEYCTTKKEIDEPVNLSALSAIINDQDPQEFVEFIRENDYEVSETFSPNPQSYRKLKRVSKKFGSISLAFDVADIISEKIIYSDSDKNIIIRNPPEDLVSEIQNIRGDSEEDE